MVRANRQWLPYLFLLPAILLILCFMIYPVGNVFYYSLQNFFLNRTWANGFIGLDNFKQIFQDSLFFSSLKVSAQWVFWEVSVQLILGLAIALLLNQTFKGRGLIRALVFSPWAISGVLTAMMWSMMYNQQMGVINDLFLKLGLIHNNVAWLGNVNTAFWAVALAELWRGIPFFAITLLAALQTIPLELYESCEVDGGGKWILFTKITLPFLKETIVLSTLLRVVWEFNNVDALYAMTGGGPANLTTTLSMYIAREAIQTNNFGYGSALMVIGFMILLIFAIIYLKASHFGKEE
jgi:multiple sugar transport system permease protein